MDTIVYNRLKTTAETPTTILSVPTPKSTNFNIPQLAPSITVDAHVTAQMIELQERIAVAKGWLKELERSVYWQREEYRRTEKAMGRKKSGQSGGVGDAARKIVTYGSEIGGQHDEGSAVATGGSGLEFAGPSGRAAGEEFGGPSGFARGLGGFSGPGGFGGASGLVGGQSGLVGGSGLFDGLEFTGDVDEDALSARLAAMDASIMREQAEGQGQGDVLRQKDYARERWSSGKQSRLPTQDEWEQMFGKGVSLFVYFVFLLLRWLRSAYAFILPSRLELLTLGCDLGLEEVDVENAESKIVWRDRWLCDRWRGRFHVSFVGRLFAVILQRYVYHIDYPTAEQLTQVLSEDGRFSLRGRERGGNGMHEQRWRLSLS